MLKSSLVTLTLFISLLATSNIAAKGDPAWTALHNLDIRTARPLFEARLKKSPKDLAALRGLALAACLDMDNDGQAKALADLVAADPGNPLLVAVIEHVSANLESHARHMEITRQIGEGLNKNAVGGARYLSFPILESYYVQTQHDCPIDFLKASGTAPGAWVAGPFDNQSNIAAYRAVPAEHDPLDTLATIIGKGGYRASWTWVPTDKFGNNGPASAFGTESNYACQARSFFVLPNQQAVNVLLSGSYCGRLFVDGAMVLDDPIHRNSYSRGGVKVSLGAGPHEISLVLGGSDAGIYYAVAVTDTNYLPIDGLQWVRYADVPRIDTLAAKVVHPIFDTFDAWAAQNPNVPDLKYWSAVIRTYNGYAPEAVRDLEAQYQEGKLTLLESWLLYKTLIINEETERSTAILADIKQKADNPLLAYQWILKSATSHETSLRAFDSLSKVYPDRMAIEAMTAMMPLLNNDVQGMVTRLKNVMTKYPNDGTAHMVLSRLLGQSIGDPGAAYEELITYCHLCDYGMTELQSAPLLLTKLGRHDEAITLARKFFNTSPQVNLAILNLFNIADEVNRTPDLLPLVDSLIDRYPNNVSLYALRNTLYKRAGNLELSKKQLERIHELKPTAILPWQSLDSLHHNVPYDSLFGQVDVMKYWDVTPTSSELAGANTWRLLNRAQRIVFDGGVVVLDVHRAWVMLNQDAVTDFQKFNLGFTPGENFHTLLAARRLRQGQPPLEAERQDDVIVFKDLKPGDAVELHFRYWSGSDGDLWRDWWEGYDTRRSSYQRFWEYTIMTDRKDLRYFVSPPATAPVESQKFGFRTLRWSGEKTAGINMDGAALPPEDELMGRIFVTTLPDWEPIRKWYSSVSEAILADNPRTDKLARDLTRGLTSDRAKLEALYRYVVLEIPYQQIGFDYDGSIPRQPDQVLVNQWGDCKDKTHLLVGMLRTSGISAWPTLALTRSDGSFLPVPNFAFDHEIVACQIDGDTIYVDPSDLTANPFSTVTYSIAGQPGLPITPIPNGGIMSLPSMPDDLYFYQTVLTASLADTGASPFVCDRVSRNTSAGDRRDQVRGQTLADLKSQLGDAFSDYWGTPMTIDSLTHDSSQTVDTVFRERWYGRIRLNVNLIGRTSLITLPDWSALETSLPTNLMMDHARTYPAVLDPYCGTNIRTLKLTLPASLGEPQITDPIVVGDSLYSFNAVMNWDKATRVLTLDFKLVIRQGRCDRAKFADFATTVIKTFKTPILCQQI